MAKRTIEIDDTLDETIDSAIADIQEAFKSFRKDNPDMNPEDWEAHDDVSSIADSATPVYTSEITGLWYLYSDRFETAFDNAGIYGKNERPDNYEQVAIYCYIESELWEEVRRLTGAGFTECPQCGRYYGEDEGVDEDDLYHGDLCSNVCLQAYKAEQEKTEVDDDAPTS